MTRGQRKTSSSSAICFSAAVFDRVCGAVHEKGSLVRAAFVFWICLTGMRMPEKETAASALAAMCVLPRLLLPAGTAWKIRMTERTDSCMH